jgi:voltage-gated potassium channel
MAVTEATDTQATPTRPETMLERFERLTEWPMLLLSLAMVPLLLIPILVDVSRGTETAIDTVFWVFWAIFAVEFGVRVWLAERKMSYVIRHWPDVLIVVVPFLRPLRIARSARAMRALRVGRVLPFLARAWHATHDVLRRRGLEYVLASGIIIVLGSSGLVLAFEQGNGPIDDYGTALWWAMSTVTTVGYGDTVPETPEGRGIAVVLMLVGISFFSWITANIAAFLVEFGGAGGGGDEKAITTHDIMAKLEQLETEIKQLRSERSDNRDDTS